MKYIPILFSTAMVQALLDGRKTQTRRVVKPQPTEFIDDPLYWINPVPCIKNNRGLSQSIGCPYGHPGDVLWVRETWAPIMDIYDRKPLPDTYCFAADLDGSPVAWNWKPNIHMPKKACRLFLKVKSIRVERLWDISEEDAKAEGAEKAYQVYKDQARYKLGFNNLWEKINGTASLESNPWVWVVEFERTEKPANWPNY